MNRIGRSAAEAVLVLIVVIAFAGCAPTPPPVPAAGPWFPLNNQPGVVTAAHQ